MGPLSKYWPQLSDWKLIDVCFLKSKNAMTLRYQYLCIHFDTSSQSVYELSKYKTIGKSRQQSKLRFSSRSSIPRVTYILNPNKIQLRIFHTMTLNFDNIDKSPRLMASSSGSCLGETNLLFGGRNCYATLGIREIGVTYWKIWVSDTPQIPVSLRSNDWWGPGSQREPKWWQRSQRSEGVWGIRRMGAKLTSFQLLTARALWTGRFFVFLIL